MAAAAVRRTLTPSSPFTRLSSRFHPSLAHALHDDDRPAATAPPRPPPPPPPYRSVHNFTSPLHPLHRLGLNPSPHRFYSSSAADGGPEIIKDVADVITDTSFDTSFDTVAAAAMSAVPGEVAAAAADSYLPVAALQYFIDGVHSLSGLNWWASIVLTTIFIRGATVPLLLNQMKSSVKLGKMRPELEEIKAQMDNSMDPESIQEGQKKMKALFKKHGVTPFTPLKGMFIQGPIFISFFLAISNMAEKVPSFKEGGAFWFVDLTTPDSLYVFPVLTAASFLATVELNMQEGMEGNPMANTMKKVSRFFGLMTIPLTAHFPKAIFCYWITSNLFSLTYGYVIRRPPVRKFLNLPDIVPPSTNPAPQSNFSLFGGSGLSIFGGSKPPTTPSLSKESEQIKTLESRVFSSSSSPPSSAISKRIKNLEKTVKSRSKIKPKKR